MTTIINKHSVTAKLSAVIVFIFLLFTGNNVFSQKPLVELVSKSEKAVFEVKYTGEYFGSEVFATGFFIDSFGTCVSNYHVWEHNRNFIVKTFYKEEYKIEKIIGYDSIADIIVFTIENSDSNKFAFLTPNFEIPLKGQDIFVIGHPQGYIYTLSEGTISAIREKEYGNDIQFTAPISHGSSGSPVIDMNGNVIGVAKLLHREGQNMNFAVEIGMINKLDSMESDNYLFVEQISQEDTITIEDNYLYKKLSLTLKIYFYPEDADLYYQRAQVNEKLEMFDEALDDYNMAIKLDSDYEEAYILRGCLKYELYYDYKGAIKDFKKAIKLNPFIKKDIYYIIGLMKYINKDYKRALKYFNKVLKLDPYDEDAEYYIDIITYFE